MSGSSERVELGGYDQDTYIVNMYKLSNSKDIKIFGGYCSENSPFVVLPSFFGTV